MAGFVLRPEHDEDLEFLYSLYASTRADEMAMVNWTEEETLDFLRMQFAAKRKYYLEHYGGSRFDVIEHAGNAIGRLYVARWPDEINILDITLALEYRGRGYGGRLMQALLDEAAAAGKCVSIHVEVYNPAINLYERLGFQPKGEDNGVYRLMEWRATEPV